MSGSSQAAYQKKKAGRGRPATLSATEVWAMRVNPAWLERVREKAKDWGVTPTQLIRALIDQGLEGDMAVLFPPREDPEVRYVPVHERLRKGGRR